MKWRIAESGSWRPGRNKQWTEKLVFIQPTVITVEKKRAISFAVDARAMNQELVKDKRQDPNSRDFNGIDS